MDVIYVHLMGFIVGTSEHPSKGSRIHDTQHEELDGRFEWHQDYDEEVLVNDLIDNQLQNRAK